MPALLRLPKSAYPNTWYALKGYSSLEHLQQDKWERHSKYYPPREFNPAWMIEPSMVKFIPNGVEIWKWSIAQEKWAIEAEIIWKD